MSTNLRVTTLGGDCHHIEADANWTIKELKSHMTTIITIPFYQQRVLLDSRMLEDVEVMKDIFPNSDKTHDVFLVCCEDQDRINFLVSLAMGKHTLEELEDRYREDPDIVLAAVHYDGLNLRHALGDARKDRNIILAALSKNGFALAYAREFTDDREAASIAAISNSFAYTLASPSLQNDVTFAIEVVSRNPFAEDYIDRNVKDSKLFREAKKALKNCADAGKDNRPVLATLLKSDLTYPGNAKKSVQDPKKSIPVPSEEDGTFMHGELQKKRYKRSYSIMRLLGITK